MAAAGKWFAFCDTETNGLVAHTRHLLEIAVVITDEHFNPVDREPFHAVIHYTREEVERLKAESDDVVLRMHTETGLWNRLEHGTPLSQVELDLVAYLKSVCPEPDSVHFAGNSVRLDLNFIEQHLPAVAAHAHYRVIDISTLDVLARLHFGVTVAKASDHTALVDVLESIEQARILWGPLVDAVRDADATFASATPRAAA